MGHEKRHTPSVSLTHSEKTYLEKKAKKVGVSYTRYMREVALGELPQDEDQINKYDKVEAIRELRAAIDAIGKNINQLARVANESGQINLERITEANKQLIAMKEAVINELL